LFQNLNSLDPDIQIANSFNNKNGESSNTGLLELNQQSKLIADERTCSNCQCLPARKPLALAEAP